MMRAFARLALAVVMVNGTAACGMIARPDWTVKSEESGIDGKTVTAIRQFRVKGNPTFAEVSLVCHEATADLVLDVKSLRAEQQGEMFPASPLVQDNGQVVGRVRTALSTATDPAAYLLYLAHYNNLAEWPLAMTAANVWAKKDSSAFKQWMSAVMNNPDAIGLAFAGIATAFTPGAGDLAVYTYLKQHGRLAEVQPGKWVRELLPITIELQNEGGAFEVTIPANDPQVNQVLDACTGKPPIITAAPGPTATPAAAPATDFGPPATVAPDHKDTTSTATDTVLTTSGV